jgi:long-chain acyl-CoA synthetase
MVYGDSKKSCTVAIIVPQILKVENWAKEKGKIKIENDLGKNPSDLKTLTTDPDLKKLLMDEISNLCKEHKLSGLERPKDIWVTFDAFTIENNLLTPTFKLKRNVVTKEYEP